MADSFAAALKKFGIDTEARVHSVFTNATEIVEQSVLDGSPVTGAPGQPVDTGALRASWIAEFESKTRWNITATGKAVVDGKTVDVGYARHVEDNVRGVTFNRGGPHSVALTTTGWDRIVDAAAAQVRK